VAIDKLVGQVGVASGAFLIRSRIIEAINAINDGSTSQIFVANANANNEITAGDSLNLVR